MHEVSIEDQLERVKRLLKKVTYKPGWKLDCSWEKSKRQTYPRTSDWDRIFIMVQVRVPDAIDPQRMTTVHSHYSMVAIDLERFNDGQIVDYFIRLAIQHMEEHEFCEWFKFDGICVKDPHPEQKGVA